MKFSVLEYIGLSLFWNNGVEMMVIYFVFGMFLEVWVVVNGMEQNSNEFVQNSNGWVTIL